MMVSNPYSRLSSLTITLFFQQVTYDVHEWEVTLENVEKMIFLENRRQRII